MAYPVEVKGLNALVVEIHNTPAAEPDSAAYGFVRHVADAAGFGKPLAENAKICLHVK